MHRMVSQLTQDLRSGARGLGRRPGFAAAAVVMLGLGIGATTALFSAADHVLLRPLPYPQLGRVVTVWEIDRTAGGATRGVAPGDFLQWRERSRAFEHLGLTQPSGVDLTGHGRPEAIPAWRITEGFLEALGAEPVLGRRFAPEDYLAGAEPVVLLSHGMWQRRFASDADLVGRTIQVDYAPALVVGVLPPWLDFPEPRELWAPKHFSQREVEDRTSDYMQVVGLLRPGFTVAEAQAEMDRVAASMAVDFPSTNADTGVAVVPLAEQILGDVRPALLVMLCGVVFLLLIACANVAGLVLARGAQRDQELGVRAALGASRGRLARHLLAESALLGALGGALGLALAYFGLEGLRALGPPELPRIGNVALDGRSLVFAVSTSALTVLLFGAAPALQLAGSRAVVAVPGAGRSVTSDRGRARFRGRLVVVQIGLSLVLLIGAGLLMRSFVELLSNDPGFATERRVALQTFLWDLNPTPEQRRQRVAEIAAGMRALPEVGDVAVVSALPFHPHSISAQGTLLVAGRPPASAGEDPQVFTTVASPKYFPVMAIPLNRGRLFTDWDRGDTPPVALINESLARRHFPGEDPVGQRVTIGVMGPPLEREIVGVVTDVRPTGLDSEPRPELFVPYLQSATGSVTFVAQTVGRPEDQVQRLREVVWEIDPDQTIYHASTLDDLVAKTLHERRFHLALLATFSLVALALAAIGNYGLVSFATAQRTREIGLRLALGARRGSILRLVVGAGLRLAIPGVLLGAAGALLLTRYMEHMLYAVTPTDPATFLMWTGFLLAVAVVGAYLPARRAARLDPAATLRGD